MAMTMTRNYQRTPAIYPEDQEQFGTYTPKVARRSLPTAQRQGNSRPAPKNAAPADVQNYNAQVPARTTDELEDEPHTSKQPIPIRGGNGNNNNQGRYQPQAGRPFWQVLLIGVSFIAGILTILYTIAFLVVSGCILLFNVFNYGPTHTAYTQTTINGQATTIETSNVNGTILITLINNQDGSAKTYTGPALQASAWNGDLNGIVATADIEKNQTTPTITVHLIGSVNYFHLLFARPQMKLQLIPDKQAGYKVIIVS